MVTPVEETCELASSRPAGTVPPSNRRFPLPSTSGKVQRRSSSISPCSSSVWIRFALPCTCSSGPSSSLSARTPSGQLRVLPFELLQRGRRHVLGRLVERLGAGIVGVRPVGREDLVGLATEDEVEGL